MPQPDDKAGSFRCALVQLRSSRDTAASIDTAVPLIRDAAARADYVLTPENTSLMEMRTKPLFAAIAPEEETPALGTFRDLAAELRVWLHIGSIAILVGDRRAANRSFLLAPDGGIAARYDKIHMFDVDLPGGESYRESKNYRPGEDAVLAALPWGMLGLTTCYDLRFPEQYIALAQTGADFITVPSAFTRRTGAAHWHVLLRARAIETGCYIFAAAQGGLHDNGRETYGHSLIVDPWGEIIAEISGDEPGLVVAEIDPAKVEQARARIPALQHRRDFRVRNIS
ncbi:MAG: carbon-nitrogen hydrolase family protein [Dichotomicrobium sp.]